MKYLVCLDGNDEAKSALGFVLSNLARKDDTVYVASVAERFAYPVLDDGLDGSYVEHVDTLNKAIEASATKCLSETQKMIKEKGFATGGLLCFGNAVEGIEQAAEQFDVDLLVLGHRHLGPVQSLFSSSVAGGVVHNSTRPVMVVK
mmetsp:Transcript_2109/g.7651  ORF Transcript_2109/g.7651 Transcript_2109/m.7651 type:complete len:146 (-) Transcript_2109:58-495(-)